MPSVSRFTSDMFSSILKLLNPGNYYPLHNIDSITSVSSSEQEGLATSDQSQQQRPIKLRIRLVKTEPGQPTIGIAEGRICIQIAEHFPDQSSHGESEIIQTVPEIKTEPEEPPQGLSLEETGAIDDYETKPSPQLIDVLTARNTHENVAVGDDSYNKETGNYWINTDVTSFTTSTKTESQVVSDKSHKYPELRIRVSILDFT
ncbi:hypothetical protein RF11_04426 [Thelohanellus kitauei]|uniref:Uncharacterized protein n=1 Tax=Thelohanellus kitauei TaxID=669202 RepID=A0A0C2M986_THEKT|nr:hypothetical protein RF11_04426 [Thelohanellus kitauei]